MDDKDHGAGLAARTFAASAERVDVPGATLSAMLIAIVLVAAVTLGQQPADAPKPEPVVIKAGLGSCSSDFMVKDAAGQPAYAATVHVKIRYGLMHLKRMDLEVSTGPDGKARVEGLPAKARPLVYDIAKGDQKATVEQNLETSCQASHEVSLK